MPSESLAPNPVSTSFSSRLCLNEIEDRLVSQDDVCQAVNRYACLSIGLLFMALLVSSCRSVTYAGQTMRRGSKGLIQSGVCMESGTNVRTGEKFYTLSTCAHKNGRPDLEWLGVTAGTPVTVSRLEKRGSYTNGYWTVVYVSMKEPQTGGEITADATHILMPAINGAVRASNQFLKID